MQLFFWRLCKLLKWTLIIFFSPIVKIHYNFFSSKAVLSYWSGFKFFFFQPNIHHNIFSWKAQTRTSLLCSWFAATLVINLTKLYIQQKENFTKLSMLVLHKFQLFKWCNIIQFFFGDWRDNAWIGHSKEIWKRSRI